MKLQLFIKGLFTEGTTSAPIARYALEPLTQSVSLEGSSAKLEAARLWKVRNNRAVSRILWIRRAHARSRPSSQNNCHLAHLKSSPARNVPHIAKYR